MKQCKSLARAIRRGRTVNLYNGTYKSKKEITVLRQMWKSCSCKTTGTI